MIDTSVSNIVNIERAILATAIFEPARFDEIADLVSAKDFFYPGHRAIFEVMQQLNAAAMPIDEVFIKERLEKTNMFDEMVFLDVLSTSPIAAVDAYAKELQQARAKRDLEDLLLKARGKLEEGEDPARVLSFVENRIDRFEKEIVSKEPISLKAILEKEEKPNIIYSTGLDFLDDVFDGGFEMGQIITVTGEQESGKTQIVNQILFNVARAHRCLYFSLEFNERQLRDYTKKKIRTCGLDVDHFDNIRVVTDEMTTGEISEIEAIIRKAAKEGVKFIAIDSQIALFDEDPALKYATAEERTTSFFRKLHNLSKKLDVLILLIAQASKEDARSGKVEIFGSKKAAHLARIMIHINYNRDADAEGAKEGARREIFVAKNKQNGRLAKIEVDFDRERLEFRRTNEFGGAVVVEMPKIVTEGDEDEF